MSAGPSDVVLYGSDTSATWYPPERSEQTMSPHWTIDGERHRLQCGPLVKATCSPTLSTRWLWRVDVNEGFGSLGSGFSPNINQAKAQCEETIIILLHDIKKGLGI